MSVFLIIFLAICIGVGAAHITGKDDGPIEEASESIIEDELDWAHGSVDLTPKSPEKHANKSAV